MPLKLARWPAFVTACSFGPYLIGSLRTEQIAIYSSIAITPLIRPATRRQTPAYTTASVWFGLLVVVLLAPHPAVIDVYVGGNYLAGLDNYVGPLATILLTGYWLRRCYSPRELLDTVSVVLVAGATVSAVAAIVQLHTDATPYLYRFWDSKTPDFVAGTKPTTVALLALSNGRSTGLFNQPAEAGNAYTFALFATIYLVGRVTTWRRRVVVGAATLICIGGFLALSKSFLIVGMPVAAWQFSYGRHAFYRWVKLASALILADIVAIQWLHLSWNGAIQFRGLTYLHGDVLSNVTAGRLGANSQSAARWAYVLHHAPWFGFGPGGVATSYDSAWIEAAVVGGVTGLALLAAVLLALAVRTVSRWSSRPRDVRPYAAAVVATAILGSVGLPVFTANRVGSITWMLVGILVCAEWLAEDIGPEPDRYQLEYRTVGSAKDYRGLPIPTSHPLALDGAERLARPGPSRGSQRRTWGQVRTHREPEY